MNKTICFECDGVRYYCNKCNVKCDRDIVIENNLPWKGYDLFNITNYEQTLAVINMPKDVWKDASEENCWLNEISLNLTTVTVKIPLSIWDRIDDMEYDWRDKLILKKIYNPNGIVTISQSYNYYKSSLLKDVIKNGLKEEKHSYDYEFDDNFSLNYFDYELFPRNGIWLQNFHNYPLENLLNEIFPFEKPHNSFTNQRAKRKTRK